MQTCAPIAKDFGVQSCHTPAGVVVAGEHVESLRVSCRSDHYNSSDSFGGIVCWRPTARMAAAKIKPGYIHIKNTTQGGLLASSEGVVHGSVAKDFAGLEPSQIAAEGGIIGGFAVQQGEFKVVSRACNMSGPYADGYKELSSTEAKLVKRAVDHWKATTAPMTQDVHRCVSYETDQVAGCVSYETDQVAGGCESYETAQVPAGGCVSYETAQGAVVAGEHVESLRVSCRSDHYNSSDSFGGIVCWRPTAKMAAVRIKPGYIHIKNTTNGSLPASNEGVVHGSVAKDFAGLEPSQIKAEGGIVGGFAVQQGEFKDVSRSCNVSGGGSYADGYKELSSIEAKLVKRAVDRWKATGAVGFSLRAHP